MKKPIKKLAVYLTSGCLLLSTLSTLPITPFSITAEAHSGRTDSNGGHKDNKNKSGLGSYHYHCGGYPPHLHTGGVCPYRSTGSASHSDVPKETSPAPAETQPETQPATQPAAAGWQQDSTGWLYRTADNQYYKSCWQSLDGQWYYFGADGYMKTGWLELEGIWYYLSPEDGHMVTGDMVIEGSRYYFDADGRAAESAAV